jgi:putative FmdB family regulatory protein
MPKYSFECPVCNLRFERNLKVGEHPTHDCPECHDPAPLVISDFGFAFSEGKGAPANSGVHDQDYPTADKAVGRSAERRWNHIKARDKVKEEVRKQGQSPALIRHTGEDFIDYEAMGSRKREARKKLVKEAIRLTNEQKR